MNWKFNKLKGKYGLTSCDTSNLDIVIKICILICIGFTLCILYPGHLDKLWSFGIPN